MEQTPQAKTPGSTQPKSKKTMYGIVGAVVIIVIVVLGLYFAGYLGGNSGTPVAINDDTGCNNPSGSDPACNFSPASLPVSAGAKVTWTNKGQTTHTVTANATANGSLPTFDSGSMASGATFPFTFSTPGVYHYYCDIHRW